MSTGGAWWRVATLSRGVCDHLDGSATAPDACKIGADGRRVVPRGTLSSQGIFFIPLSAGSGVY
jgi:hypothetical protein